MRCYVKILNAPWKSNFWGGDSELENKIDPILKRVNYEFEGEITDVLIT